MIPRHLEPPLRKAARQYPVVSLTGRTGAASGPFFSARAVRGFSTPRGREDSGGER